MSLRPIEIQRRPDDGPWRIAAVDGAAAYLQFPGLRLFYQADGQRITLLSPDQAAPPADDGQAWGFGDEHIEVRATLRLDRSLNALLIEAQVRNAGSAAVSLERLDLLHLDGDRGADLVLGQSREDWAVFQNGWQSWSAAETLSVRDRDTSPWPLLVRVQEEDYLEPGSGKPGDVRSSAVAAILDRASGSGLLLGFISGADQFGTIRLRLRQPRLLLHELAAYVMFDGCRLDPGHSVQSETLLLGFFNKGDDPLALWAEQCGARMHARVSAAKPIGWCSWYHYFRKIDQPEMRKNVERIAAVGADLPIAVIQLDDGYQTALGDWLEINAKFPDGLQDLAGRIMAAGRVAGIWTAPFSCMRDSRVWREHPEWVLRDRRGRPISGGINPLWGGRYYGLDMTHPGALEHVERCLGGLKAWGFEFFKIDFVFNACLDGVRHDPTATRAQALRRGLEAVRRAIGDSFLLGCGCPLLPAVGVVDCMRIGPDVTPYWDHPRVRALLHDRHMLSANNALRNTITRAFMHRRLWLNDPDCLLLRRVDNRLNEHETRTLAAVIAASGGMVLVSDDMTAVQPDRLALARRAALLDSRGMRAADLFDERRPGRLLAATDAGMLAVLVNFSDEQRRMSWDLTAELGRPATDLHCRELFSGNEAPTPNGRLIVNLEPHASLAVLLPDVELDKSR